MNRLQFFSISGIACAAHTPETEKIWTSWGKNKSHKARIAIINFAQSLGFECEKCEDTLAPDAFEFLLKKHPDISGIKSWIMREAITKYS